MALTEKYVSSLAGGSGDGNSAGSAYTFGQMVSEVVSLAGAGKRYNIKADGTYVRTSGDNMDVSPASSANPTVLRGYKTTPGDGYLGRSNSNGALITTNMPLITYAVNVGAFCGQWFILESLNIEGSRDTWFIDVRERGLLTGCRFVNAGTSGNSAVMEVRQSTVLMECDFLMTATSGGKECMNIPGEGVKIDTCRFTFASASQWGLRIDNTRTVVYGCFLKGANGPQGIDVTPNNRESYIRNNTIVGFQQGIRVYSDDAPTVVSGNMITGNSDWGIKEGSVNSALVLGPNRFRDNVSGNIATFGNYLTAGRIFAQVTTDTGGDETDYVNAAGGDYNLISASPGKATNTWKYADMGAFQRQEATGGGGATVFNPLAQTIIRPA